MATELISLKTETTEDPAFAVCYARGSVFKKEGHFHRVEKGMRTVVHRSLCVLRGHGNRCDQCPNSSVSYTLQKG